MAAMILTAALLLVALFFAVLTGVALRAPKDDENRTGALVILFVLDVILIVALAAAFAITR